MALAEAGAAIVAAAIKAMARVLSLIEVRVPFLPGNRWWVEDEGAGAQSIRQRHKKTKSYHLIE
jgi:hypothetical protein